MSADIDYRLYKKINEGCPAISGSVLPDHAKHTTGYGFMSINTLRERPIPPYPKGWGLLGQLVEEFKNSYGGIQNDRT